jgi:hypothetical protein
MTTFNIIYDGLSKYKAVDRDEAIEKSNRKAFKCFQYQHFRDSNRRGEFDTFVKTRIRMIEIKNNSISYHKWNWDKKRLNRSSTF